MEMESLAQAGGWYVGTSFVVGLVGLLLHCLLGINKGLKTYRYRWLCRLYVFVPLQIVGLVIGVLAGLVLFSYLTDRIGEPGSYVPFAVGGILIGLGLGTSLGWFYVILGPFSKRKKPEPPSDDPGSVA
jgi:hypothetical protein